MSFKNEYQATQKVRGYSLTPLPYEVELKVKNNRLLTALRETFPFEKTQTDWAKLCEITQGELNSLICMRKHPFSQRFGTWHVSAKRISEATGELCEYLFDPKLYPARHGKIHIETAPPPPRLIAPRSETDPHRLLEQKQLYDELEESLKTLSRREETIMVKRYGLYEAEKSQKAVAKELEMNAVRVGQIEARSLRKLRHPSRMGEHSKRVL